MSKFYGAIKKAYVTKLNENWLVYAFSSKYKKTVNTHMFPDKREAILTRNAINS
jgi:hypothetical protein